LAKLRSEPSLIKTAIEELVRFVCPVEMATERYTREEITIAQTPIPRGELVLAVIGSQIVTPTLLTILIHWTSPARTTNIWRSPR